jgi:hypothetical protein
MHAGDPAGLSILLAGIFLHVRPLIVRSSPGAGQRLGILAADFFWRFILAQYPVASPDENFP